MKRKKKQMTKKARGEQRVRSHLKQVNLFAAGIDIGSRRHFVAVPAELGLLAKRNCGLEERGLLRVLNCVRQGLHAGVTFVV